MFTLGNWAIFGTIFGIGILFALLVLLTFEDFRASVVVMFITVVIIFVLMIAVGFYNISTAAGQRALKDNASNLNNGIDREITITAEDGREIFHFEGKVDIESNHEDNYIKFDTPEGKRYIIYYGITDTIMIIEK